MHSSRAFSWQRALAERQSRFSAPPIRSMRNSSVQAAFAVPGAISVGPKLPRVASGAVTVSAVDEGPVLGDSVAASVPSLRCWEQRDQAAKGNARSRIKNLNTAYPKLESAVTKTGNRASAIGHRQNAEFLWVTFS